MKWPGQRPSNAVNQTVTFPNLSRSYDATRRAVRFWGYDRSMENSFFVTWDALQHIQPNLRPDEAGFDQNRKLIYEIAASVMPAVDAAPTTLSSPISDERICTLPRFRACWR